MGRWQCTAGSPMPMPLDRFFRADGNDATDRRSLATIIVAITTDLPLSTFRWQSGVQFWVAVHNI